MSMEDRTAEAKPRVRLTGVDGNAFMIIGACHKAAKRAGWDAKRWDGVRAEMTGGDYDHLLATAQKHFEVT
jgi:hypothetical protein